MLTGDDTGLISIKPFMTHLAVGITHFLLQGVKIFSILRTSFRFNTEF